MLSAIPSMKPMIPVFTPRTLARNNGSVRTATSLLRSFSRVTRPKTLTLRSRALWPLLRSFEKLSERAISDGLFIFAKHAAGVQSIANDPVFLRGSITVPSLHCSSAPSNPGLCSQPRIKNPSPAIKSVASMRKMKILSGSRSKIFFPTKEPRIMIEPSASPTVMLCLVRMAVLP